MLIDILTETNEIMDHRSSQMTLKASNLCCSLYAFIYLLPHSDDADSCYIDNPCKVHNPILILNGARDYFVQFTNL